MYVWLYIVLASLIFDTSVFTKYSHMRRYPSSGSATHCMLIVRTLLHCNSIDLKSDHQQCQYYLS